MDTRPSNSNPTRPSRTRLSRAALVLAGLAAMVGCSTLPNAPRTMNRSATSGALVPAPHGMDDDGRTPPPDTGKGPGSVVAPIDTTETIITITGTDGGLVDLAGFEVKVPPGAISGEATVSIKLDPADMRRCELGIVPASANGFSKPVTLTVDCSGMRNVERMGIVWLNEATGEWEEVPGSSVDLQNQSVSAPLMHFSHYGVAEVLREGKAGW